MADITFLNPNYLWALFSIPIIIALHFFLLRYTQRRAVVFANFEALKRVTGQMVLSKNITLLIARVLAILFLTLSASGITIWTKGQSAEYDYVLAIDTSSSMLASDLLPDRLTAAKENAKKFIDSMPDDTRIGVVSFSGLAKTEMAMGGDFKAVKETIDTINVGGSGGTDLSGAIVTSSNMLMSSDDRGMAVIILTDGQHTAGGPLEEGISYAAEKLITVHTIGIGTDKGGSFELSELLSTIDETSLRKIADNTGGRYYYAQDPGQIEAALREIISNQEKNIPHPLSLYMLLVAIIVLFFEWVLLNTRFRTLP